MEDLFRQAAVTGNLILKNRSLESFPEAVFSIGNLRRLNLSENQIARIPPAISQLQNLELINISSNKIGFLPKEILDLPKLKYIFLRNNKIARFSDLLKELKEKVEILDLRNNPVVMNLHFDKIRAALAGTDSEAEVQEQRLGNCVTHLHGSFAKDTASAAPENFGWGNAQAINLIKLRKGETKGSSRAVVQPPQQDSSVWACACGKTGIRNAVKICPKCGKRKTGFMTFEEEMRQLSQNFEQL
eukprot:GCRY01001706.1.p1 GENE.GCRY01001706.1~~GCRY01001706.1.p1  ORF type:complete len:244 (+),score=21.51 GCRY01001706.1:180-911(+)